MGSAAEPPIPLRTHTACREAVAARREEGGTNAYVRFQGEAEPEASRAEQRTSMAWEGVFGVDDGFAHPLRVCDRLCAVVHVALVVAQLVAVVATFTLPMFRRVILGSLADAVQNVGGLNLDADVTFLDVAGYAARGGGLACLSAATFVMFNLVTPVLRALSLLAVLLLPLTRRSARRLYTYSRYAINYSAIDVMLIATPLIKVTIEPITTEIFYSSSSLCQALRHAFPAADKCFEISLELRIGYFCNIAAFVLLVLSGYEGSPTCKWAHRRLYPDEPRPPPSMACGDDGAQ